MPLALCSLGCFQVYGPPQRLRFKATPLPGAASREIELETAKRVVAARLSNARLVKRVQVETTGLNGLEVVVYGADEAALEKIKQHVTEWGQLEFAEVANPVDHAEFVNGAAADAEREVVVDGESKAEWLPVQTERNGEPASEFAQASNVVSRTRNVDGKPRTEWLVIYEPGFRITGDMLKHAAAGIDQTGGPSIQFVLTEEGANHMKMLTSALRRGGARTSKLAIILNGTIYTAPNVQSPISDRGEITGRFTQKEVNLTVNVLRSGRLPCQLTFDRMLEASEP
jgi:preprotein translocase subunit SecD